MNFTRRSGLVEGHALLSPSGYHWLNYDDEKLDRVFSTAMAARHGTDLHALAHEMIRLRERLADLPRTLNLYVNDAIGFRMESEVTLFYSDNCYGTADCISWRNQTLRIHDLKTGFTPASMKQLEVYAALFCLEYRMDPFKINMELRIYQNNEVVTHIPDPDEIFHIMEKIKYFSKRIDMLREEMTL